MCAQFLYATNAVHKKLYSDDTWTVPPGVTQIAVRAWGGGGGGHYQVIGGSAQGVNSNKSTGGGAAYVRHLLTVVPGQQYQIDIGAGGSNSQNDNVPGGDGADTTFSLNASVLVKAAGGKGGNIATSMNTTQGGDGGDKSDNVPANVGANGSAGQFYSGTRFRTFEPAGSAGGEINAIGVLIDADVDYPGGDESLRGGDGTDMGVLAKPGGGGSQDSTSLNSRDAQSGRMIISYSVALDDAVTILKGETVVVKPLDTDSPPNVTPLILSISAQPAHGTATVVNDDCIEYVHGGAGFQPDVLEYQLKDQDGFVYATANIHVTIEQPPVEFRKFRVTVCSQ